MPGRKRKGSKKGGPGSRADHPIPSNMRSNGTPTFSSGGSPHYDFKTTKRVRPKKKSGLKDITQRRKK